MRLRAAGWNLDAAIPRGMVEVVTIPGPKQQGTVDSSSKIHDVELRRGVITIFPRQPAPARWQAKRLGSS